MKHKLFVCVMLLVTVLTAESFGAVLPESYDLRDYGLVTPVRDQESFGTCWAFGTTAAVESAYLKYLAENKGVDVSKFTGVMDSVDLSELHMAWYARNDPDKTKRNTFVNPRNLTIGSISGGWSFMPLAYLTRLDGPVLETNLPYLSNERLKTLGYTGSIPDAWYDLDEYPSYSMLRKLEELNSAENDEKVKVIPGENELAMETPQVLRVTDGLYASRIPFSLKDDKVSFDDQAIVQDRMKELLMQYGAAAVSYFVAGGRDAILPTSYPTIPGYYYSKGKTNTNHTVTLIGWDDNYSIDNYPESPDFRPKNKGAWLLKNSWGDDWLPYYRTSNDLELTKDSILVLNAKDNDKLVSVDAYLVENTLVVRSADLSGDINATYELVFSSTNNYIFSGDEKPWGIAPVYRIDPSTGKVADEFALSNKEWGGGCFYASYEGHITEGLVFKVEEADPGLILYDYTPIGWCDVAGGLDNDRRTITAANTFKVLYTGERLEDISYYTTEAGAQVKWWVYYNIPEKPTEAPYSASDKFISGSLTEKYAGYHTVKIPEAQKVSLTKGTYFSVVVEITNPTTHYPMVVERKVAGRSDFAVVHDNESWFKYSANDIWEDGIETMTKDEATGKMQYVPMNACIKACTSYTDASNPAKEDPNTILTKPVNDFPGLTDIAKAKDSSGKALNAGIPDEPLSVRWIFTPEYMSDDKVTKYPEGTSVTYYLVNVTEDHEFVENEVTVTDTTYPTGLLPFDSNAELDPLFDEELMPDEYWLAYDGAEYPVYGPFVAVTQLISESSDATGIYLDVDTLEYEKDSTKGKIPKGYYNIAYGKKGEKPYGLLPIRLAATKEIDDSNNDGDGTTPTVPEQPGGNTTPTDPTVVGLSSSSSGCNAGLNFSVFIMLAGIALSMKKR